VQIGEVTGDGRLKYFVGDELVADVPAESLVLGGGAPVYEREYTRPKYMDLIDKFDQSDVPEPEDLKEIAFKLIQLPNIASKKWLYEQYDTMVQTGNTQTNAPSDAAVIRLHETKKALAVTTDCNSRYVFADPYKGAMIAVSEAARNIVCSGGTPVAITNCLNFGNPYDPEVYYQFVHAIKGMSEACLRLDTPVTGGNVSFYNQGPDGAVFPTPTIGMVGVLNSLEQKMTLGFKHAGDLIYMIGTTRNDINCSEYLHNIFGIAYSPAPHFDMNEEVLIQKTIARLIDAKFIKSAHDVSEGGLFTCLLESAMVNGLGFTIHTDKRTRKDAMLFGESQSRVVVTVNPDIHTFFEAEIRKVPHIKLGVVNALSEIFIDSDNWGYIRDWKDAYDNALGKLVKGGI